MSSWLGGGRDGRGRGSRKKRGKNFDVSHLGNGSVGNFFGPQTPRKDEPDLSTTVPDENRPKTAAELSMEIVLRNDPQQAYTIGGVKVQFPCKPYPSQFSMINKIMKGLDNSQNCLLESPTGSGKSLALLCSVLAWQQAQKEKNKSEEGNYKGDCCCQCHRQMYSEASTYFPPTTPSATVSVPTDAATPDGSTRNSSIVIDEDEDSDDDFKKPKKKLRTSGQGAAGGRQHITIQYDAPPTGAQATPTVTGATPTSRADSPMEEDCTSCSCQCDQDMPPKRKVPKIYFGTRTHKQVAQIARELAKTAYRDVRICILASREHTCIDPEVSRMKKKNEECKNKLDGPGCRFFDNVRKITHRNLEVNGLEFAWDLEDFVNFNRRHKSCPYFASRGLREGADLIFCPYNYLIDPVIRDNMEINLKDEIIILDEAHNMEDSARDAASYSVTHAELEDALLDINKVIEHNVQLNEHCALRNVLQSLLNWVENFRHTLGGGDYDQASKVWNGVDMVAQLRNSNIGPDQLPVLWQHLSAVVEEDPDKRPRLYKILTATAVILEKTFYVLGYIYRNDFKYMNDYRVALVRTISYTSEQTDGQWLGRNRRASYRQTFLFTLHFWCMNPAVAFSDLSDTRSIILTSGTLSPMTSFQSELAQPFPIQLEANHVINAKQVWVGAISKGPRGGNLLGSYQTSETFSYQDELGQLVLSVCKTVPHGVLCFLSSYKMLDKLYNRWQGTGLYNEVCKYKVVMKEPRASDRDRVDFDELLRQFYAVIKETEKADASAGEQTGVFFMAVCRGKVSEGMDFADNNARAVITVGIPFPNFKDTQVELKKKYNNEHSGARGLLSGSDWYEIQAYRAINQALGRCIRHRFDWGALILVDERFAKNPAKYTKGLSKWVRQKVQYYGNFFQAQRSLQEFTENMISTPPGPGQDQSMSVSQMDLSMAVETHPPVPSSPLPPVLPPAPSTSTSPPMDLNSTTGGATQNLLSTTFSHQAAPSYALPSQAGGFLVSQDQTVATQGSMRHNVTQGNIANTQVKNGDLTQFNLTGSTQGVGTQVVNGAVHVVAAPPPTQPMDLDQTMDFAPPLASTQLPGKLNFQPRMTSTQMHSQAGRVQVSQQVKDETNNNNTSFSGKLVSLLKKENGSTQLEKSSPGKLSFESKGKSIRQKLAKFSRKEKDDDPPYELPKSGTRNRKQSGKLSQSVDPVSRYGDEELDIDERSTSPLLFDGEDNECEKPNTEDFDAVVDHIAGTTLPKGDPEVSTSKPESNQNLGKRPLFKAKTNASEQEKKSSLDEDKNEAQTELKVDSILDAQDENCPPVDPDEKPRRRSLKGRLSRKRSNDSMNNSSLTLTPNPKQTATPNSKRTATDPTQQQTNQNNTSISEVDLNASKNKSVKPRANTKRPPKGVNFDSEGEEEQEEEGGELRTKRSSRSKRRRVVSSSACTCTSEYLRDMKHVKSMASSSVCCNQCGSCLYHSLQGTREEQLPGYVISVLPGWNKRKAAPRVAVCDQNDARLTQCTLIEQKSPSGLLLNSMWSTEGGCCLRFYQCPSGQCDSTPVAVCVVAKTSASTAKEGQVWFLPLATSISEPT